MHDIVRPRRVVWSYAVALCGLLGQDCLAQQAPTVLTLDPVVVTETRTEVPLSHTTRSVTVITQEDIAAQGAQSVPEVLRHVPGLQIVRTGASGGMTSLFTRGGEADYTKVLVDGVELNRGGGAFDFADLTTDNIERIEIIRGSASTLYGSGAIGGVIHIITKRGQGRPTGSVEFAGGSFDTRIWRGHGSVGTTWGGLSAAISRSDAEGHLAFNNQYDNTTVALRGDLHPDDKTNIAMTLRHSDGEFHFPTDGAGRVLFRRQFRTARETVVGVRAERELLPWWQSKVQLGYHEVKSRSHSEFGTPPNTSLSLFSAHEERVTADWQSDLRLERLGLLTAGLTYDQETLRGNNLTRRTTSGYAQQQVTMFEPLILIAGLRADDNSAFGFHLTYQGSAAYAFPTQTKIRAALGTGFKAPTFFENFNNTPTARGNSDLDPERSLSWEVGVEQTLWDKRLKFAATYFANRYKDLIEFTARPAPGAPNFFNIQEVESAGAELSATLTPLPGLEVGVDYTYLHTEVIDPGFSTDPSGAFVKGRPLLRRPQHKVHLGLTYARERLLVRLDLTHVGDREDRDFAQNPAQRVINPAYSKLDLSLRYTVLKDWRWIRALEVLARGENMLDDHYAEALGFTAPGIAGFGGMKATF
ncbi:MAG: TonB-dependent receptor plug domain-containing protein [Candidatus Tectimicrobiota bacterium]